MDVAPGTEFEPMERFQPPSVDPPPSPSPLILAARGNRARQQFLLDRIGDGRCGARSRRCLLGYTAYRGDRELEDWGADVFPQPAIFSAENGVVIRRDGEHRLPEAASTVPLPPWHARRNREDSVWLLTPRWLENGVRLVDAHDC